MSTAILYLIASYLNFFLFINSNLHIQFMLYLQLSKHFAKDILPICFKKRKNEQSHLLICWNAQFLAHHNGVMCFLSSGTIVILTMLKMAINPAVAATISHVKAAGKRTPTCTPKKLQNNRFLMQRSSRATSNPSNKACQEITSSEVYLVLYITFYSRMHSYHAQISIAIGGKM